MKTVNLFLLLLIATLISCKNKEPDVVIGNSKFRLVNAVQGSVAQDFYQGDTKISTSAIAYGESSDYLTVKAGSSTITFKGSATQEVSATASVGLNTGVNYTVFYTKTTTGGGEIIGYPETDGVPPAGKAGVRFANLGATLSTAVVVNLGNGDPLTNSLPFGNITAYAVLDPSVELKFSLVGSTNSAIIPAATFQSGKLYTVWFDASNTTTAQYHVVTQN